MVANRSWPISTSMLVTTRACRFQGDEAEARAPDRDPSCSGAKASCGWVRLRHHQATDLRPYGAGGRPFAPVCAGCQRDLVCQSKKRLTASDSQPFLAITEDLWSVLRFSLSPVPNGGERLIWRPQSMKGLDGQLGVEPLEARQVTYQVTVRCSCATQGLHLNLLFQA